MNCLKLSREDKIVNILLFIVMTVVVIITFYPLYYSVVYAFSDANDIAEKGFVYFAPRVFTLDNFKMVFTEKALVNAFLITLSRTVLGTVASVLFTAVVSYPLSKRYLLFRKVYLRIGVITMYFFGGLIPFYLVLKSINLINSFWVYIIPMLFSFFNAIIFINFFSAIPDAIEESAKIDGANDWSIFWQIVIPLSAPVMATMALFNGVTQWNSWFDAAFYTTSENLATLQLVLYNIISQAQGAAMASRFMAAGQTNMNVIDAIKYATMVISIVPIALAYPFLQKYFVQGMMVGSIKE